MLGAVPSTLWLVLAATFGWASFAPMPDAARSVAPFFSSVLATTATPVVEVSPDTIV